MLAAAGFRLDASPVIEWHEVQPTGGRPCWVPDRLWRLPPAEVLADVVLPLELNWSAPGKRCVTRDRRRRARLYELLLREGTPSDLERWIDGVLLADLWNDMVLPRSIRRAWQPVLDSEVTACVAAAADPA